MRKLNLRLLRRQPEAQAQVPQPLQPVVQRAAAQLEQAQRAQEQLEPALQQVRLALRERLQARSQPWVQPLQVPAWLVLLGQL